MKTSSIRPSAAADADNDGFGAWRTWLREILKSRPRVILDANRWFHERLGRPNTERAAFRLGSSARIQREFVSLWELFDDRDVLGDSLDDASTEKKTILEYLSRRIRSIRDSQPFGTIVTSTDSAKHLLDQVHSRIESEHERVRLEFLPYFPFLTADRRSPLNFAGERVLILTDVVASTRLVSHLAEIVTHLGGEVVAAVCIVLVGPELIAEADAATDQMVALNLTSLNAPIPLFSLTDYRIPELRPEEFDADKLIRVDAYTVYPEDLFDIQGKVASRAISSSRYGFSLAEMYHHLDESDAIDFDFFEQGGCRFMTAVRLHRLLSCFGNEIWAKLRELFLTEGSDSDGGARADHSIVTTFNTGDDQFKEFVEDRLRAENRAPRVQFIHRRTPDDRQDGAFFISPRTEGLHDPALNLQDRPVVILLSAVQSAKTLRDLVSYVASAGAKSIRVVCLLNRMGMRTQALIQRIRKLLRGHLATQSDSSDLAGFEFQAAYNILDLPSDDIAKMQESAATLCNQYLKSTSVPSFRRWVEQVRKYFESQPVTSRNFRTGLPARLAQPFRAFLRSDDAEVEVLTVPSKLSALCARRVLSQDMAPAIAALGTIDDKRDLYKLFALVLLDLSHLRLVREFNAVRDTIWNRITVVRRNRMDLEVQAQSRTTVDLLQLQSNLDAQVELETHLLFGLALFSYLDHEHRGYELIAQQALFGEWSLEEWVQHPLNLSAHFGDQRVVWTISMLMHLSRGTSIDRNAASPTRATFVRQIRRLQFEVQRQDFSIPGMSPDALQSRIRRIKDNLDLLLADLGIHHLTTTFEQIRFLQSHLWKVKQRHSPIDTILSAAMRALEDAVFSSLRESPSGSFARRVYIRTLELQESLEEAVYTCGLLEQVARAAQGLFDVTPFPAEEARRFLAPSSEPGFLRDVLELGDRFQAIRIDNLASTEDVGALRRLRFRVLQDLWDESSPLQRALRHFVVPLRETLVQAMIHAAKSFAERNHPWQHAFERCLPSLQSDVREWRVLVDLQLLREVLRNLCTNVRHTFSDLVTPDASIAERIEWEFREVDELSESEDRIHFVEFEFRSIGRNFDAESFEQSRAHFIRPEEIH